MFSFGIFTKKYKTIFLASPFASLTKEVIKNAFKLDDSVFYCNIIIIIIIITIIIIIIIIFIVIMIIMSLLILFVYYITRSNGRA